MKWKTKSGELFQIQGLKRQDNWMQSIFLEIKDPYNRQNINRFCRLNKSFNPDFVIVLWLGKRRFLFLENTEILRGKGTSCLKLTFNT